VSELFLVTRFPLFVGHAVDDLSRLRIGQLEAPLLGRLAIPARETVAAEPGQLHQVDVLYIGSFAQMLDQPPKRCGFKFGAGALIHRSGTIGRMTEHPERRPEVPADPSGIEEPHDVLAADEFGIGTRDERLPPDPSGITEPHDVLAAEEFAMPAGGEARGAQRSGRDPRSLVPLLAITGLTALLLLWGRRRR
jgi:hypothetical protein